MTLILGGVVLFGERLSRSRRSVWPCLVIGLLRFFNCRLPEPLHLDGSLGTGAALLMLGTFVWSSYGLAQKRLQQQLDAHQILAIVFTASTFVVRPFASPGEIFTCRRATRRSAVLRPQYLIAYGCFAESLKHWEISRVSAILSMTPLFTLGSMRLVEKAGAWESWPREAERAGGFGALLVVAGSGLVRAPDLASPGSRWYLRGPQPDPVRAIHAVHCQRRHPVRRQAAVRTRLGQVRRRQPLWPDRRQRLRQIHAHENARRRAGAERRRSDAAGRACAWASCNQNQFALRRRARARRGDAGPRRNVAAR